MQINSSEYWEERFSSKDWEEKAGDGQSAFFASLALQNLPAWLCGEISKEHFSIADLGCAEGGGAAILAGAFPDSRVTGFDISPTAIKTAASLHANCSFEVCDITNQKIPPYDIVFSSNVLEHFEKPFSVLENFFAAAKKYMVLLIPFEEAELINEHFSRFSLKDFKIASGNFWLSFYKVIDCQTMDTPFWNGRQLLLIYTNSDYFSMDTFTAEYLQQSFIEPLIDDVRLKYETILSRQSSEFSLQNDRLAQQIDACEEKNKDLQSDLKKLNRQLSILSNNQAEAEQHSREIANLVFEAQKINLQILGTKSYKMIHFLRRIKKQFIFGSFSQKKVFIKWLTGSGKADDSLNTPKLLYDKLGQALKADRKYFSFNRKYSGSVDTYMKNDVIVLSIIPYDFRYQRPQQFSSRFAKSGHRVFYVESNFAEENQAGTRDGQFLINFRNPGYTAVYQPDSQANALLVNENIKWLIEKFAILDAVVIVQFPNWYQTAMILNEKYGFKIVTDYMDDFTGFSNTGDPKTRDTCIDLLRASHLVVASSNYLFEKASVYNNNMRLIRNGTEFSHFSKACREENGKARKTVGYYGAVAEWFDYEKVCYMAQNMPDVDFVVIGNVTANEKALSSYKNIILKGEKPYAELPEYLAGFDVCIIPFDTSTDLIKATNPVKFYEYLSAGKKVVATEIPELEPYRDEYVYLSNDNREFLNYVKLCLDGKDTLKSKEECQEIAKDNDWDIRFRDFSAACDEIFPLVSIIVLTYNGLAYTKICINSILDYTAYPNFELIIVDNRSTDGTGEYLNELKLQNDPRIKIILNEENVGFAAGNNIGIKNSGGDYVVLLNNDVYVTRGWLTSLIKNLERDPEMGMCGSVTNSIGNEARIPVDYSNLYQVPLFSKEYVMKNINKIFPDPDVLAMFCVAIKREVIDKCGLLDEGYSLGMFEDDDYSARVRTAGYRLCIAEDSFVHHFGSASFKMMDTEEFKTLFDNNMKRFNDKFGVSWKGHKSRDFDFRFNDGIQIDAGEIAKYL